MREIGIEQISETGVVITIEEKSSNTWRESAKLAARIANDITYQQLVTSYVEVANREYVAGSTTLVGSFEAAERCSNYLKDTFSTEQYYDSGVAHAAYMAIVNELKREARKN